MTARTSCAHLVALALLLAATPPATAAFTDQGIEIDGDYEDDPSSPEEDWYPGFPPATDPVGSDDDTLCGTSPAPKNDISHSFMANDFDYLYLGMERLTNNGNTSFFFAFDITGDGPSVGDFIFVFCFGSGSVVTDTYVLEWDPTIGDWVRDATPPGILFAVNTARVPAPFGALDERGVPQPFIDEGKFAEARITLADIEGFDICEADAVTGEIQTKSSCSLSSECKDTTGPFTFSFEPLTVSLQLAQPPACEPSITATANASTGRTGVTVTYQWFLNGTDITDRDPSYATSDSIAIALADECGPTEVRVVASDGTCTAEDTASHDVNRQPVAGIAGLAVGSCDLTLAYDGTASTDCNGTALTYAWDFDGDGVTDSTAASGTFTYAACGDRTVTLVVSDGECASPPAAQVLHVNEPPVARLQVVPDQCLTVTWSSATEDCDLTTPSALYAEVVAETIDFGDGSPIASGPGGAHVYDACGTYVLTLTATDASGCVSVDSRQVTFTGVLTVN
jgi:hypothetical protein